MADPGFELALERMFAETPAAADADLFALRVLERVDRGWTVRRLLIGVMGAAGGLIGAFEMLGSGAVGQFTEFAARSDVFLTQHVSQRISDALAPIGLSVDNQAIWMAGALAAVAIGLGLARFIREI